MRSRQGLALVLLLLLLSSCGAALQPLVPTLLPTSTAQLASTLALTRAVATAPPTATRIIAPTATFGPSPTYLPGSLQIEYFTTDVQAVADGDVVMLFWSVRGVDNATIYRLDPAGARGQSWAVARVGQLQVTIVAGEATEASFALVIGGGLNETAQVLRLSLTCSEEGWFFTPSPGGCPPAPAQITTIAQLQFERGQMFWVQTQGRIYALFDTNKWAAYPDTFRDGQPETDPNLSPPEGRSQPIRGFGLIWRDNPSVRDGLGWAIGGETGFESQVQGSVDIVDGAFYLRGQDGKIYELNGASSTWRLLD
jgi:hypothetical protein